MAATTTPNALARSLGTTPKTVRTVAREVLSRFDKAKHPEYQSHAYTVSEVATLRAAFAKRGSRAVAPKAKAKAAPKAAPTA